MPIEVGSADAPPMKTIPSIWSSVSLRLFPMRQPALFSPKLACLSRAVIIRVPELKESALPQPPIQEDDLVQGRLLRRKWCRCSTSTGV